MITVTVKEERKKLKELRDHIVEVNKMVVEAEEYYLKEYEGWRKNYGINREDDNKRHLAVNMMGAYRGIGKRLADIGNAIDKISKGENTDGD